jgi:hypothetical protein
MLHHRWWKIPEISISSFYGLRSGHDLVKDPKFQHRAFGTDRKFHTDDKNHIPFQIFEYVAVTY